MEDATSGLLDILQNPNFPDDHATVSSAPRSASELALLRESDAIGSGVALLASHHIRIQQLEKQLQTARSILRVRRALIHNATQAPISLLPNEILSQIFRFCNDLVRLEGLRFPPTITTITHTCSHWREVAVNYCPLWINIDLRWPLPKLELWSQRAGILPLNLILTFSQEHNLFSRRFASTRFYLVERAASFRMMAQIRDDSLVALHMDRFLEEIHKIGSQKAEQPNVNTSVESSPPPPYLQFFETNDIRFLTSAITPLRLSTLTSIRLSRISQTWTEWRVVFLAFTHLENMDLYRLRCSQDHDVAEEDRNSNLQLTMGNLRSLSLLNIDSEFGLFVSRISMPKLKHLEISTRKPHPFPFPPSELERTIIKLQHLQCLILWSDLPEELVPVYLALLSPNAQLLLHDLVVFTCGPSHFTDNILKAISQGVEYSSSSPPTIDTSRWVEVQRRASASIQWLREGAKGYTFARVGPKVERLSKWTDDFDGPGY